MEKTPDPPREQQVSTCRTGPLAPIFRLSVAGIIIGGDFNTNHDGQFGDETVAMLTEAGFVNTWDGVPKGSRRTWKGGGSFDPTTFDYIMTKGLPSAKADLVKVDDEASDHNAVRLEIPIRGN